MRTSPRSAAPRRARLAAVLAGLLLTSSACGGPEEPILVGVKEVPSDIVLGGADQGAPPLAPIPPVAFAPDSFFLPTPPPPAAIALPAPPPTAPPTAREGARAASCPPADPLAAPSREAVNSIMAPPAPGRYERRTSGTFETAGADARRGSLPEVSVMTVKNVLKATTGSLRFYFDVEVSLGGTVTTTTYTLVPEQRQPLGGVQAPEELRGIGIAPALPPTIRPGLFISRVVSRFANGRSEDFRPSPALLLMPFPAVRGDSWQTTGASGDKVVSFTGTVGPKVRVDACGTALDALSIHIDGDVGGSEGPARETSTTGEVTFVAEYALGTQYGGLALSDKVVFDRREPGFGHHQESESVINVEPAPPSAEAADCGPACAVR